MEDDSKVPDKWRKIFRAKQSRKSEKSAGNFILYADENDVFKTVEELSDDEEIDLLPRPSNISNDKWDKLRKEEDFDDENASLISDHTAFSTSSMVRTGELGTPHALRAAAQNTASTARSDRRMGI